MSRTSDDGGFIDPRHPSVIAGVFGLVVFAASLVVLAGATSIDLGDLLLPFAAGFLVFVAVYFVVMVLVEPYLRT